MWNVIAIDKKDKTEVVLVTYSEESHAERFCEMWGWNYDDGKDSYWLSYEEV